MKPTPGKNLTEGCPNETFDQGPSHPHGVFGGSQSSVRGESGRDHHQGPLAPTQQIRHIQHQQYSHEFNYGQPATIAQSSTNMLYPTNAAGAPGVVRALALGQQTPLFSVPDAYSSAQSFGGDIVPEYTVRRSTCFNCGAFTHIAQYCPELQTQNHSGLAGGSQPNVVSAGGYGQAPPTWVQQGWTSASVPQLLQEYVTGPSTQGVARSAEFHPGYPQSHGQGFHQSPTSFQSWANLSGSGLGSMQVFSDGSTHQQPPGCQEYSTFPVNAPPPSYNPPAIPFSERSACPAPMSYCSNSSAPSPGSGFTAAPAMSQPALRNINDTDANAGRDSEDELHGLDFPDNCQITGAYSGHPIRQLAEPLPQSGELADILSPLPTATIFESNRPASILFRNLDEDQYLRNVSETNRWAEVSLDPAFAEISLDGPSVSFEELERRRDDETLVLVDVDEDAKGDEEENDEVQQSMDQEEKLAALGVTGSAKPVDQNVRRAPRGYSRRRRNQHRQGQSKLPERIPSAAEIATARDHSDRQSNAKIKEEPVSGEEEPAADRRGKGEAAIKRELSSPKELSASSKRQRGSKHGHKKKNFVGDDPDVHPAFYRR